MTIQLHYLEYLPILIYLIMLLVIGFRKRAAQPGREDFILGGRQLTLPAFVATLVTTWYGGILGVGEFTYLYGISNWIVFGVPYYIFAFLFAIFLAPKIQPARAMSIPDQFFAHYGKSAGYLGAIFTLFMTLPAPYVLMVGLLIQVITGWSLWLCIVLGALFSMVYVISGGFRAVVRTDKLQFLLMFVGFAMLLIALVIRYGGISFLTGHLPRQHFTWHGGNSPAVILAWFFIASWTFIDPGFHQRCYAAKSPGVAQKGILLSVLFWLVFDFLTTATGLYARALLSNVTPALSFPLLGHQFLPPLLSGLFFTALLAVIMSTVDSFALLSAITIGYDLFRKPSTRNGSVTKRIQTGLIIVALLSILLAILIPSVIQLWFVVGNIFIAPMLLPLLACYYPKLRPDAPYVVASLVLPFLISVMFLGLSISQSSSLTSIEYWLGFPPMYPGLFSSVLLFVVGNISRQRKAQARQKRIDK